MKDALKFALNRTSTDYELVDFLKDYELIFEVNLLASKLLSSVSATIGRELDMSKFLNLDIGNLDIQFSGVGLKGNSLDLMDDSNFVKVESNRQQLDLSFLPNWKIGLYAERLLLLNKFMYLREVARWLTVKGINQIKASLSDLDLFRAIDEHDVSKDELSKRKQNYDFYNKYELPAILSNELQIDLGKSKGVSSGLAKGELVAEVIGSNEQILYVRNLTPNLVQFFPLIKGIISEKGGMLSHCAIMAREKGIPVVVNFDLSKSKIKLGDKIQINGDTGEVIL